MATSRPVTAKVSGDVAHIILNNPQRRNAISRALHHQLGAELRRLKDAEGVRFIVIRGQGGNFSSGGDLRELKAGLPANYVSDYWQRMAETVLYLRSVDQVVICAVEGTALGAGAALALAGDIVLVEQDARLRFHFVHLGLLPDAGTSTVLPASIGLPVSRDLILSGRWISAQEAHQRGLVARIVPAGEMDSSIASLLDELRLAPAETLTLAKNLLAQSDLPSAVRIEGIYQLAATTAVDYRGQIERVLGAISSAPEKKDG